MFEWEKSFLYSQREFRAVKERDFRWKIYKAEPSSFYCVLECDDCYMRKSWQSRTFDTEHEC